MDSGVAAQQCFHLGRHRVLRFKRADYEQMKGGELFPQGSPRPRQLRHAFVPNDPADEAHHLRICRDVVARARVHSGALADVGRIETVGGIHTVDAATEQDPDFQRRAERFGQRHFADGVAHAENLVSKPAGDPLAPAKQQTLVTAGCGEGQAVHVVDAHRNPRQPSSGRPQQASFGGVGVDDGGANPAQRSPEPENRNQIAQRRDAAGHLNRMNCDLFALGKLLQVRTGRRNGLDLETPRLHVADLPGEKTQRHGHSRDLH